jgi:hypothetical protein
MSQNINHKCPCCRTEPKNKSYETRSKKGNNRDKEFVSITTYYLNSIYDNFSSEFKIKMAVDMFEYVLKNIWFLEKYPNFKEAVRKKLVELYRNEKFVEGESLYFKIFNIKI